VRVPNFVSVQNDLKELSDTIERRQAYGQPDYEESDQERFAMYRTAESIEACLDTMEQDIQALVDKLNQSYESGQEQSSAVGKFLQVLNSHQQTFDWVEEEAAKLELLVNKVDRAFRTKRPLAALNYR